MNSVAVALQHSCETCCRRVAAATLTFTEEGQRLCRGCHGQYVSMKATQRARKAEEYRRCSRCGKVVRPVVEMMETEEGEASIFAALRSYACRCGHRFSTLSGAAMVLDSVLLAIGCYFAGKGWSHADAEQMIVGTLLAAPAMGGLLWDAWSRRHHPRVLGTTD